MSGSIKGGWKKLSKFYISPGRMSSLLGLGKEDLFADVAFEKSIMWAGPRR